MLCKKYIDIWGKPKIQLANEKIFEYDYNDRTNKMGELESAEWNDIDKEISK